MVSILVVMSGVEKVTQMVETLVALSVAKKAWLLDSL